VTPTQRVFAVAASLVTFAVIIELIRRRKLREEYAFLWVVTGAVMIVLSSWYGLIEGITRLIGAVTVTTTLFLFALLFLLLISVHFTTVLSRLTVQVRRLTQELAILQASRRDLPTPGEHDRER
jgi:ABC-type polysaccharide/polyol phosphate export permease